MRICFLFYFKLGIHVHSFKVYEEIFCIYFIDNWKIYGRIAINKKLYKWNERPKIKFQINFEMLIQIRSHENLILRFRRTTKYLNGSFGSVDIASINYSDLLILMNKALKGGYEKAAASDSK